MKKALYIFTTLLCLNTLSAQSLGDVNNDSTINIVDALIVAQEYVGLDPPALTHPENADVNCDSVINIIDALIISQYYVGLITVFPCSPTPVPTPTPTPTPTPAVTPQGGLDIRVESKLGETDPSDFNIYPHFKIANHGSDRVQLSSVTVRYWYSSEAGPASTQVHDFWNGYFDTTGTHRELPNANVTSAFFDYGPTAGADVYFEMGFLDGPEMYLDPGEAARFDSQRIRETSWKVYDETNDYSYNTNSDYQEWDHMTLYVDGDLAWGIEPGVPPKADFSWNPERPMYGQTVTFDGSTSTDSNGTILTYNWNFGDGTSDSGRTASHSYSMAGNYDVILTVYDDDDLHNSKKKTIGVYTGDPVADFTWLPERPQANTPVTFNGSLSFDVDGSITDYSWNFGDGGTATGRTVIHKYAVGGSYQVTLTVRDNQGNTGSTILAFTTRSIWGAIRWDAWVGDLASYGETVEATLSPNHWHYRVPFYGVELAPDLIQARCTTQEVVDHEIAYAKAGGMDYFAFLMYDDDPANWGYHLGIAIRLYLTSQYKSDINFCIIMPQTDQISDPADWSRWLDRFTVYFKDTSYQMVLGGRPLVYALRWKGWTEGPNFIQQLKSACISQGIPVPYFVDLHWEAALTPGFDAMSGYAHNLGSQNGEHPYSDLTACALSRWNARLSIKQIPLATSGWDGRPRVETSTPWTGDDPPFYKDWYIEPTPLQLADHLCVAMDFVEANPTSCEANAVLMYAWNEFDEGGWICPTLFDGNTRLDAIKAMLDQN